MIEKIKQFITLLTKGELAELDRKQILKHQWIRFSILFVMVGIFAYLIIIVSHPQKRVSEEKTKTENTVNIETANKAIDPDKMWRNHFEEKLIDSDSKLDKKLKAIGKSFSDKEKEIETSTKLEIESMRQQLNFAREELNSAILELQKMKDPEAAADREEYRERNFTSQKFDNEYNITRPKSMRNFIPETAYVKGVLLGGLSVSTALGSSSEPVPVVIRITNRGTLPKNFDLDLTKCKILGSGYGDLSSERAVIRVETMSCNDMKHEQIITTKVAGIIYGDDGANGIKGKVTQANNKHIRNAFMGGLIGGLSKTAKMQDQFAITSIGAVPTKSSKLENRILDGGISGVGNAGEKIADYYLRQAEAMSPVLQIPGGTKVDIVFTKGVYIGGQDVRERINEDRKAD